MRLTKKTLCYSVLISAVLMAFVVVYFCFMMPSLYVDYAKKDDLKSVVDVQKGYMKNRSYKGLTVKNPTGSMSVEIPLSGDTVYIAGKNFRITVQADEPELKDFLQNEEIENPLATAIVTGDKPLMGAHLSAEDGKVKLDTI